MFVHTPMQEVFALTSYLRSSLHLIPVDLLEESKVFCQSSDLIFITIAFNLKLFHLRLQCLDRLRVTEILPLSLRKLDLISLLQLLIVLFDKLHLLSNPLVFLFQLCLLLIVLSLHSLN
jgi:hypothetical protein